MSLDAIETLLDLFQLFAVHGSRTAIVYRTGVRRRTYSYADLQEMALRMNRMLAERGVAAGDRVLLWGPNSPWWAIAFWGIIARGAVVVPIDFASGRERAESIAAATGAAIVIQSSFKTDRITGREELLLEELEFHLECRQPLRESVSIAPDDIAELIYTSGTTGSPKGVILTHRNLVANLRQVNRHIPVVTPDFTLLSLLPLSHMFEQMGGFFTPLLHGSGIVYLRTLKPAAIMEGFHEEEIDVVIAVPRLLQLLRGAIETRMSALGLMPVMRMLLAVAERFSPGARKRLFFPVHRAFGRHFRLFVSGGAPLDPELFRFWSLAGFTVVEGYGLTECSPVLTANTLERQVAGSVGIPLPEIELKIVAGEICARGPNIFPGYYGNLAATESAFTDDGWFRTGDLGELGPDGGLRIKGRSKELIVTGAGVNVYPDEIEAILNRVRGVREVCVVGYDRGGGEEVHAVLVPDGSGRRVEEIIAETNEQLDDLHRITGWTIWPDDEFPKTTTLKIRKFMVRDRLRVGRGGAGNETGGDRLSVLIARIIGTPFSDVTENALLIRDLGLTSIGRLELVNALEQEFRLDLEESQIGPDTRVSDLRGLITRREKGVTRNRYRFWTNSPFVRGIRRLADIFLVIPLLRLFVTLEYRGRENLDTNTGPVLFIANHVSYFDQPSVMLALPPEIRYRTATAAWGEFFFKNYRNAAERLWKIVAYELGTFCLNLFPLPQTDGFRTALRFMGRLADHGINILVFPEGERSPDGKPLPFKYGLGIMVRELGVPVLPVAIHGLDTVLPRGSNWPRRGKVTVVFGPPLEFRNESPESIVERSREELRRL